MSKFIVFSGRASRSEYWWFVAAGVVASAIFSLIVVALGDLFVVNDPDAGARLSPAGLAAATLAVNVLSSPAGVAIHLAIFLLYAFFSVTYLSVAWRRLHDVGRPGWVLFLPPATMFGGGLLLALFLMIASALLPGAVSPGGEAPAVGGGSGSILPSIWMIIISAVALGSVAMMIWVFVQLVRPSQPGPNRFGDEPSA